MISTLWSLITCYTKATLPVVVWSEASRTTEGHVEIASVNFLITDQNLGMLGQSISKCYAAATCNVHLPWEVDGPHLHEGFGWRSWPAKPDPLGIHTMHPNKQPSKSHLHLACEVAPPAVQVLHKEKCASCENTHLLYRTYVFIQRSSCDSTATQVLQQHLHSSHMHTSLSYIIEDVSKNI